MFKIDLHTHSTASFDGGITKRQYKDILDNNLLDFVAVTDHNETRFARELRDLLGDRIIVGEEIRSKDGEVIGLFLKKTIRPGLSVIDTIREIKEQDGLVYIPHPFEKGRESLPEDVLTEIVKKVDIVEAFNARGLLRGRQKEVEEFAVKKNVAIASSSDAHCRLGVGTAFSIINSHPDRHALPRLLKKGHFQRRHASLISYLCPAVNKVKNSIFLSK